MPYTVVKPGTIKTLGLLGGMSYHSTLLYYRLINAHVQRRLGSPHSAPLVLYSFDFGVMAPLLQRGDWPAVTSHFVAAGTHLRTAGAQGLAIGCNIGHAVAGRVRRETGLPVLHVADAVAQRLRGQIKRVGLLATRVVMEAGYVKDGLGVDEVLIPEEEEERERLDGVIFGELAAGMASHETRRWMHALTDDLVRRGAEGVVLACTDLQAVVDTGDVRVPVWDTLEVHAEYLAEWALGDGEAGREPVCH